MDYNYHKAHRYIKPRLDKPSLCMVCKENPSHDLHNISGEYHYEIDDWMWVCRSCHQKIHKSGSWMKNVWNSEKSLQRKIDLGNRSRGNKWAEGNSHPPWNKGTRKNSA